MVYFAASLSSGVTSYAPSKVQTNSVYKQLTPTFPLVLLFVSVANSIFPEHISVSKPQPCFKNSNSNRNARNPFQVRDAPFRQLFFVRQLRLTQPLTPACRLQRQQYCINLVMPYKPYHVAKLSSA